MNATAPPVFRFAPSPNGALHLGHAYSALLNQKSARETGGTFLLRIEDIDTTRCTPALETAMLDDLRWLGVEWDALPLRQSDRFPAYRTALDRLIDAGLAYPAFLSRRDIRDRVAQRDDWPTDPDGAPHYPGDERHWDQTRRMEAMVAQPDFAWRLDMALALEATPHLTWQEKDEGTVTADPAAFGDVVLARSDTPTSYHLSVVVDDAAQGVTDVVRGRDLYHATGVHRLLQHLLALPEPRYHHHDLLLDETGAKLSKSSGSTGLAGLRAQGVSAADIRRQLGFDAAPANGEGTLEWSKPMGHIGDLSKGLS